MRTEDCAEVWGEIVVAADETSGECSIQVDGEIIRTLSFGRGGIRIVAC